MLQPSHTIQTQGRRASAKLSKRYNTRWPVAPYCTTTDPSPRMWGKRLGLGLVLRPRRTIPTHVGKTETCPCGQRTSPDHPHACGENRIAGNLRFALDGPSPRMWGKLLLCIFFGTLGRTIPTHVGKTAARISPRHFLSDHPHACGENNRKDSAGTSYRGPSPRMWGKQLGHKPSLPPPRTIPTHVGKTGWRQAGAKNLADHPHACGENQPHTAPALDRVGPSPRMWGKPIYPLDVCRRARTIPTHVGKTAPPPTCDRAQTDHPHACGENFTPP